MRFTTVAGRTTFALDPIQGSRFLATVDRVRSEDEARALVEAVRQAHGDARHHCWAWRLADGRFRSSDAGEPGGSAGRPILAQIEGHGLAEVGVVVSRWFGGVKLGVGGLIRAYGGCAGKALDRAPTVEVIPTVRLWIAHDYADTGAVEALLGQRGLARVEPRWTEAVRFAVDIPWDQVEAVRRELLDRTGGRASIEPDQRPS